MPRKKYSFRDIEEDLKEQYLKEAKSYNLRIINPTTTKTADENQDLEISRKKWTKQADLEKELSQLYGRWDNEKYKNLSERLQINRELNRLFNEKDFMKNKNKVNELFKRRILLEEGYENLKDSSQNNTFQNFACDYQLRWLQMLHMLKLMIDLNIVVFSFLLIFYFGW